MLNNNPSPDSVADLSVAGSCMLTKQQPLTSSPFYKKPDQGLPLFDLLAFFTSSSAAMTSLSLRNSPAAFATFRLVQNTINSICWHSSSSSLSFLQQDNKYWSSKQHTNILQYQYLINTVPFSKFLQTIVVIFQTLGYDCLKSQGLSRTVSFFSVCFKLENSLILQIRLFWPS